MAVVQFGNHMLEGVKHVEIGTGIEVSGSQRGGSVQQVENANTVFARMLIL